MQPPEHLWFHDAVSALTYSFAEQNETSVAFSAPFNDITRFILRQRGQMPDYLRAPMLAATLGFDAAGFLKGGKCFHRQAPELRKRQIAAWKYSHTGFKRDLIRYYETLATFALHSRDNAEARPGRPESFQENIIENPAAESHAEIVIIGSGPGGAITACLLAEAGRDVLLVEEGGFYAQDSCEPFSKDEMLQKYRNGGQTVAFGKNKIGYVEGRCVGGGSEINSALYHRTPPEILDRWRKEFQVKELSEPEMRPHFESCERDISVSTLPCPALPASLRLHDGATRLGWKSLEVPRWFRYAENSDRPKGTRQSMTETFVPRFLRAGGKILPRTRVHKLRQDGMKWVLEAKHNSQDEIRISAGTVFLCAGAIQTPALLRRSGITRKIGDSLQVHPTAKIVARFSDPVNAAGMGVPVHQVKEFAPRLSFGCSISSPAYLALGLLDHPQAAQRVAADWNHMAIYYAMITSEGRGTVRTLPGFRDPLVRYSLTKTDRTNLADGLQKLARILFESGASSLCPGLAQGRELLQRDDIKVLPDILPDGLANLMTIHLFSSCPMGEDRDRCAADSFGRVHGYNNLFINDASLLCTAPGVNPQGSIMALARRNILHFLGTK
jgi:choline dehydrogenase-like flavoprotein